jgi:hypothetical protein
MGTHWTIDPPTRAKMSASRTGKKHTAATLKKMSIARDRYWKRVKKGLAVLEAQESAARSIAVINAAQGNEA